MNRLERRTVFSQSLVARQSEGLTPDIFMIAGFGNTTVIETVQGLVVIDVPVGNPGTLVEAIRTKTDLPVHTIIYTHIHADHAFTTAGLMEDAQKRGHRRPLVIAQELSLAHIKRYQEMDPYNWYINQIQGARAFRKPEGTERFIPENIIFPNITYRDSMAFKLGDLTLELRHYLGETDDGTWVWIPERKVAIVGDLLEGSCPNIGNPFKVQRYDVEWAEALEKIAGNNPEFIVPGHGPLLKEERAKEWCLETARYLRYYHDEVIRLLNEGYWIEDILHMVKPPKDLIDKRFLSDVYGCSTFLIHGIHRRYAGWYNGNPSELFPAHSTEVAAEVLKIASTRDILARAKQLMTEGKIQLALHLVDFIIKGSDDNTQRKAALLLKAELLDARAEKEQNSIARNIFLVGAEEAEEMAKEL
jgi:alkyl sulfatase BDS1-like metallo-beta-lactamase superfamily hydrolase